MKVTNIAFLGYSLFSATAAASRRIGLDEAPVLPTNILPGAYLVELNDGQNGHDFLKDLRSRGLHIQPRLMLNYKLFNGVSFRVLNATEPDHVLFKRVASPPGVKNAWPLRGLPLPRAHVMTASQGLSANPDVLADRGDEASNSPQVMAQINRLHEAGFTGKGIRVGIIDTGIDYTHPALGGCFGEGCLIAYGKDLVGKNYSWDDPPVEDDDPMDDDCPGSYGHGTHVAGIIAAQPNEHGFVGAAPGATLGFYKVCGGVPYLPDDLIVSAMNMAVEDGSDVLSISIGLISASPDNPAALMASRIVLDGTPVVSAASNAGGFSSYWSVTSPCVGSYVTCVGAVVPDKLPLFVLDGSFSVDNGPAQRYGRMRLMYNAPVDFPDNVTLPVWDASLETGLEEAACEPLPDDTPDLSDHLVIVGMGDPYRVRDSSCLPDVMVSNLADKGARHIMVYPRKVGDSRALALGPVPEGVSVGVLPKHYATTWREALAEGSTVDVTIVEAASAAERLEFVANDDNPGTIPAFASWGPSDNLELNPQVVAPGDFILSTYPLDAGGYTVIGGTSMAAPLVAGLYALLMEARGTKDPLELLSAISSTAKPLEWFDNESVQDFPAPVAQQGAGLVQGFAASRVSTYVEPASVSFNDTTSFSPRLEFSVVNNGDEEVTYQLSHVHGPTAYALASDGGLAESSVSVKPFEAGAKVEFDPDTVTLAPGDSANITIVGEAPLGLDEARLPVYGGWVRLDGSNNQSVSVPYIGLAASLGDAAAILPGPRGGTWFGAYPYPLGPEIEANTTFNVPRPTEGERTAWFLSPSVGDPTYRIVTRAPTPILRVDVVALDEVDLPTEEHLGYQVVGTPIDLLGPFPVKNPMRAPFLSRFTGLLWSGVVVPEGRYQLIVSSLRVYGEEDNDEDWDIVELPPFILKYMEE